MKVKNEQAMASRYTATVNLTVRLTNGRTKTFTKGEVVSAAVWLGLPSATRSRFEPVARVRRARGSAPVTRKAVEVADAAILELFLLAEAEGYAFEGGYADVWAEVVDALGLTAQFAHFRALQLARVGRQFESLTGVSFANVCPGLPAVASDWVSAL